MENEEKKVENTVEEVTPTEKVEEVKETPTEVVENVVETPTEKVEEVVEQTFNNPIEIESEEAMLNKIDTNQIEFNKYYSKVRKTSTLIMVVCMAVIVVLLLFFGGASGLNIGVSAVAVVVYFIIISNYSKKTKNKLNEESLKLLDDYFSMVDSYVTSNEEFTEICFNRELKIHDDTFKNLRICKDIDSVVGRDLIKGKLCRFDFIAGDNCIKTKEKDEKGNEQTYIVFLGKLFSLEIPSLVNEGRAIIYLKGKGANGPTDIEDLNKVDGLLSDKYAVYASFDVNTVLNKKVKSLLEKFEVNDHLIDMFITIDEKGMAFGFSYSDGVMVVPLTEPLNKEALIEYKKNVELMVEIVSSLNK